MAKLRPITLLALALGFVSLAGAQTLDMEGTQPAMDSAGPTRGMTLASLDSKYATPLQRHAADDESARSRL